LFSAYVGDTEPQQRSRQRLRWLVPRDGLVRARSKEVSTVGDPGREIVEVALWEGAQLIVVGSVGHGTKDRMRLGSTTRRVIREARCPVLVIPSTARSEREPAPQGPTRVVAWSRT
jgi:nucleotide-binding universal stress UspA family protein